MEINKIVGANIRRFREFKDMKQDFLAEKLNKSPKWLGQVENGIADIHLSDLHRISEILDLQISTLLYSSPNQIFNNYHQQGTYIASQNNSADDKVMALYERIIQQLESRVKSLEDKGV